MKVKHFILEAMVFVDGVDGVDGMDEDGDLSRASN